MMSIFIVTFFLLIVAIGIIMLVLVYQKNQLKYIGEKKQLQATFEKEILETQLEIREQTLKNISQEIHDNIGQALTLAKLHINTVNYNNHDELQEKITDSKQLISKAIQDLRDLSKSLHTDYVSETGLVRSIEYELEMIKKTGSYEIEFSISGIKQRLEDQKELIIFRIVQEALHNIIRHAKATVISISLIFEPQEFKLTIMDNGVGFDSSKIERNDYEGFGLGTRNMHNRANMIKANLQLTSTIEEGTRIILTLPLSTKLLIP